MTLSLLESSGVISALLFLYVYDFYPRTFRYYFKFSVYYLTMTSVAFVLLPVAALRPRRVENMVYGAVCCQAISRVLGIQWRISDRGKELLGQDKGFVIIINHQSSLDVLGLFELWPTMRRCTTVSKRELLYAGPFGLYAWLAGTTFIRRKATAEAKQILTDTAAKCHGEGIKLLLFPEGTRHHSSPGEPLTMLPFKQGAFRVAIESGMPVLPVVFSHYDFIDSKEKVFEPGVIDVTVLDPINTNNLNLDDTETLMEETRERMLHTFVEKAKAKHNSH